MLAEITTQQMLAWGGLLVIVGYFYFRSMRPALTRERIPFEKLKAEKEAVRAAQPPVDFIRWQVEMHETARELKAEIDTKMVALNTLIRSAREEEERLSQLLARAEEMKKN